MSSRWKIELRFAFCLMCIVPLQLPACTGHTMLDTTGQKAQKLHVSSPDWRDQLIYFLLLDRFNDGDSGNNNQGMGEYDPSDSRKFSGGDLQGVIDKLDYLQELGFTTVWISPPVANQWWNPRVNYGGYHGYWAENFTRIDRHFGSLELYKKLSHELHRRGMYLVQDIVVNHTGDFFGHRGGYNPADPAKYAYLDSSSLPVTAPTQYPFSLNDVRDPRHRALGVYHWTPGIRDYADEVQRLTWQLSDLDDLNTGNPLVRRVLRESYAHWIREAGVDGYRIDTVIYLEDEFWHPFIYNADTLSPGIDLVARRTGRDHFLTFGEAFISADPLDDAADRRVAAYQGSADKPGIAAMLNFPLAFSARRVFAQGKPTAFLGFRLNSAVNGNIYRDPHIMPTFLDNHDMPRFLADASPVALRQALLMLLTIPGIPVVYQGTEQGFTESRRAMFRGGYGADGRDAFDTNAPLALFLKKLTAIRRENSLFSRGDLQIIQDTPVGAGILVYSRNYQERRALVIFNTAEEPVLLSGLQAGLAAGQRLELLYGEGMPPELVMPERGLVAILPPRAMGVYLTTGGLAEAQPEPEPAITIAAPAAGRILQEDVVLSGMRPPEVRRLQLIIDGKSTRALDCRLEGDNGWSVVLPVSRFPFGETLHSIQIYAPQEQLATPARIYTSRVALQGLQIRQDDPLHDDSGPAGRYRLPQHPDFDGQMDIEQATAVAFGGNLQLSLRMRGVSALWNPPNGFDHVVFNLFIDLPERRGSTFLPEINTAAPAGFDWDYRVYCGGWTNQIFQSVSGASAPAEHMVSPAPVVTVDMPGRTLSFTFSPEALGDRASLAGSKIYITTWDGRGAEGRLRSLSPEGGEYEFGGGDGSRDPLIMDDLFLTIDPQ